MAGVVRTARVALSGAIHEGFVFTLVAVSASIVAALAMENVKLERPAAKRASQEGSGAHRGREPAVVEGT